MSKAAGETAPLLEQFRRVLRENAENIFLIEAATGRQWTYAGFHALALGVAEELGRRGLRRGDRVAILLPNCAEFVALYFGALYAGVVVVPVNAQLHPRELEYILTHSGATVVVFSSTTAGALQPVAATLGKSLWRLLVALEGGVADDSVGMDFSKLARREEGTQTAPDFSEENLFSITFTSGTTAMPKGVCHRVSSLLQSARAFNAALQFSSRHRFYHVLPMSYMAGFLNTLICPFMAGASIVLEKSFDARLSLTFWNNAMRHEANTFWLVPSMLAALLKIDRDANAPAWCRARSITICVGTAPLPPTIRQDFETRYGVRLYESYGLSETLFVATQSSNLPPQAGSVGRVLPGTKLRLLKDGKEVAVDEEAEIFLQSDFAMAGYLDLVTTQPDPATAPVWFPTGDIGRVNAGGELFITARKKDLIIRGGMNISPRAIEEVLLGFPGIEQVAVIGLPHPYYGEEIVACFVLKAGGEVAAQKAALNLFCKEQLGAGARPDRLVIQDQLPVGVTGKIQKQKLKETLSRLSPSGTPA